MEPLVMRTPGFEQIRAEFAEIRSERRDIGARRIIAGWLLDPPNPFDSDYRPRPGPEVLIVASYVGLMVAVFVLFNWT